MGCSPRAQGHRVVRGRQRCGEGRHRPYSRRCVPSRPFRESSRHSREAVRSHFRACGRRSRGSLRDGWRGSALHRPVEGLAADRQTGSRTFPQARRHFGVFRSGRSGQLPGHSRDSREPSRNSRAWNRGTGEQRNRGTEEQGNRSSSSEVADATTRPEIDSLLDLLDERIRQNGAKVPSRTKRNWDAARLLIDRDKRTPEQIATAINWATNDEFWRSNILSMSKLREKYEQLRMAAQRASAPRTTAAEKNLSVVDHFARLEGGQQGLEAS